RPGCPRAPPGPRQRGRLRLGRRRPAAPRQCTPRAGAQLAADARLLPAPSLGAAAWGARLESLLSATRRFGADLGLGVAEHRDAGDGERRQQPVIGEEVELRVVHSRATITASGALDEHRVVIGLSEIEQAEERQAAVFLRHEGGVAGWW